MVEPDGAGKEKDVENEGTVAETVCQRSFAAWWSVVGETMKGLRIGAASTMVFLCE